MRDILFLMEHPRVEHIKQVDNGFENTYFNTQNGNILKAVFKEYAGLEKREYEHDYVYNAIPDALQKKGNKITKYKPLKVSDVTKDREYTDNNGETHVYPSYEKVLKDKIIQGKPKVVIPTGNLGCKVLIGTSSITKSRGVPTQVTLENENDSHTFWVLPTLSIEYVNMYPNLERLVASDLSTLRKYLAEGDSAFQPKTTNYELVTDIERVKEIFNNEINKEHDGFNITAWDLETNTLRPELEGAKPLVMTLTWKNGQGVTIPIYKSDFQWANGQQDIDTIVELIKEWQKDVKQEKVGHNLNYDIRFLRHVINLKHAEGNQDTKVGWYLAVTQEESESLRLSTLAYEVTDMGGYDTPLENYKDWFTKDLLKHLSTMIKDIVAKNKTKAKQEHNVNKNEYVKWINEQIKDSQDPISVYNSLSLTPEIIDKQSVLANENTKDILDKSKEYKDMSDQAKDYTLDTAIELINEYTDYRKVKNSVDDSKFSYDWIPLELLHPYASGDTDVCRRIYTEIRERMKGKPELVKLLTKEYPRLTRTLTKMSYDGLPINVEHAKELDNAYTKELNRVIKEINKNWSAREVIEEKRRLYQLGVEEMTKPPKERDKEFVKYRDKYRNTEIDFNPNSIQDKTDLLFNVLNVDLPYTKDFLTDKAMEDNIKEEDLEPKHYKTSKHVMEYVSSQYPEYSDIMELMLEYSALATVQSTFTSNFANNTTNGYLHPIYNETGTDTGRLSSRNPNAQNLPKPTHDVTAFQYNYSPKSVIQSKYENGVILQLDYSSLESRVMALYANDTEMTQSFLDGEDIHKATAALVYKKDQEDITDDERQSAKAITFGLAYGKSSSSYATENDVSQEEADRLFDDYYEAKQSVKQAIDYVHDFAITKGYVETMQGFRRNLRGAQSRDISTRNRALRQSFNTIIQGSGAFLTNMSLTIIDDYLTQYNLKSKLIITVHDSIVVDCPRDEFVQVADVCKYVMENLPYDFLKIDWNGETLQYPIEADYDVGFNYSDLVGFDSDEFKSFNSIEGYVKYKQDLQYIKDCSATGTIDKEKSKELKDIVESNKETYQNM